MHCRAATGELAALIPTAETASWGGLMSVLLQKPQLDLRSTRGSCTGVVQESTRHPGASLQSSPLVLHVAWLRLTTGA